MVDKIPEYESADDWLLIPLKKDKLKLERMVWNFSVLSANGVSSIRIDMEILFDDLSYQIDDESSWNPIFNRLISVVYSRCMYLPIRTK